MSEEPPNLSLDQLTEATAEAIIFTMGATTGDPKPAIIQLLLGYLKNAHEQKGQDASREHPQEKQVQQH
jgi:hypothetical protein